MCARALVCVYVDVHNRTKLYTSLSSGSCDAKPGRSDVTRGPLAAAGRA